MANRASSRAESVDCWPQPTDEQVAVARGGLVTSSASAAKRRIEAAYPWAVICYEQRVVGNARRCVVESVRYSSRGRIYDIIATGPSWTAIAREIKQIGLSATLNAIGRMPK